MQTAERLKMQRTRRKVVLAVWLAALAILMALFLFVSSAHFALGSVEIEENKYVPVEDVLSIASIPDKINVFSLETQEIKKRLLNDLRISEAEVYRKFPVTVVIKIKERKPVAFVATQHGFAEIDGQGIALAVHKNLKQVKAPVVTGIRLGNIYVGDEVGEGILKDALEYLSSLDEAALNQLSELNIKSSKELTAYTLDLALIKLGDLERLPEKARLTAHILEETNNKKLNIEYIDLRYTAPVLKLKQN